MVRTPLLLLVFNRPETTAVVLQRIREIKPVYLYIASDGPRKNREGEEQRCAEVKALIDREIDWECEVHKLYREENLGCGKAVSAAITWFFEHVEEGIILEDDCLPDPTFFVFATQMLEYYREEEKVMHISGTNLQCGIKRGAYSYYFSNFPLIWGWATWRRSWKKYAYKINDSNQEITETISKNLRNKEQVIFFSSCIVSANSGKIDTWDFQWVYALQKYQGLSIIPQTSLIQNIGFDREATHTKSSPYWYKYLVQKPIESIKINPLIQADEKADKFYLNLSKGKKSLGMLYIQLMHFVNNI